MSGVSTDRGQCQSSQTFPNRSILPNISFEANISSAISSQRANVACSDMLALLARISSTIVLAVVVDVEEKTRADTSCPSRSNLAVREPLVGISSVTTECESTIVDSGANWLANTGEEGGKEVVGDKALRFINFAEAFRGVEYISGA